MESNKMNSDIDLDLELKHNKHIQTKSKSDIWEILKKKRIELFNKLYELYQNDNIENTRNFFNTNIISCHNNYIFLSNFVNENEPKYLNLKYLKWYIKNRFDIDFDIENFENLSIVNKQQRLKQKYFKLKKYCVKCYNYEYNKYCSLCYNNNKSIYKNIYCGHVYCKECIHDYGRYNVCLLCRDRVDYDLCFDDL